MPQYALKTNIITTQITVPSESNDFFFTWQSQLNDTIAKFPGFLSLEILSPEALKIPQWTVVQRFSDLESAAVWVESQERKFLFQNLSSHSSKLQIKEITANDPNPGGVTEVIITQVDFKKSDAYKKWLAKIHHAESQFPGFRGMYVQSPGNKVENHWITLLEFDTMEHLDEWLASDTRKEILKELDPLITSLESHRIISPFAGWFRSIAKVGQIPPVWKQTMLVLLVLFPIVMLEFKFLNPITKGLNISAATFIGNAISVTLISWPMMPIVIRLFKRWLTPDLHARRKVNLIGTAALGALYLLEIVAFWSFV